jgi:Family of unknown function (DUF5317)
LILLFALAIGLLAGLAWARLRGYPYQPPDLRHLWLVFVAFLPQFIVIYLPLTRENLPKWMVVVCLLSSQVMLFGFAWCNRRVPGMSILICGIALNLAVMAANSGFMPISPQTASRVISEERLLDVQPGSRLGPKDILLHPEDTRFEWLADRFLPPGWFPYQVAFSLGDVLIAIGAFWMLASPGSSSNLQIEVRKHDSPNNISK